MKGSALLVATVAAATLGIAAPAMAQTVGSTVNGADGNRSNTTVNTTNNSLDLDLTLNANRTSTSTSSRSVSNSNSSQRNGNIRLVADQELSASITNRGALNFNGRQSNYSSGGNSVNGSAFAAYAGILNQAWNTGINSNAQSATNIAAQGTTSFNVR